MLTEVVRLVARLTASAFAGACLYILLVQHPVRMSLAAPAALDDFRATIPRAERLQAPLLVVSLLATALSLLTFRWTTVVGGVLLLAVLVQTIVTVLPINQGLLAGEATDHLDEAPDALRRWGRLHAVRTVVAVVGVVALLR
ncbi:MAG TPA: anthrone oxygenase family protein [Friedmanniella sp.]